LRVAGVAVVAGVVVVHRVQADLPPADLLPLRRAQLQQELPPVDLLLAVVAEDEAEADAVVEEQW
jgi:hypothetical protein